MEEEVLHRLMEVSRRNVDQESAQAKLMALERRLMGQAAPPTPAFPESRSANRQARSALMSTDALEEAQNYNPEGEESFEAEALRVQVPSAKKRKARSEDGRDGSGPSALIQSPRVERRETERHVVRTISDYFDRRQERDASQMTESLVRKEGELKQDFAKQLDGVVRKHREEEERWKREYQELQSEKDSLSRKSDMQETTIEKMKRSYKDLEERSCKVTAELAVEAAEAERRECRARVCQASCRLGAVVIQRAGAVFTESWEDGEDFRAIFGRQRKLAERREALEALRKSNKRRLPPPGPAADKASDETRATWITPHEFVCNEEVLKARLLLMKREEEYTAQELERLEGEKRLHIRELKRIRDEEASRFNMHPILHDRYVLLNLLGKGGFSEVYKALDLKDLTIVACKLHQLNPQWSESRKQSYVKHAIREYDIHKALQHENIVQLLDIFEVDTDTFGTILEFCEGGDLDWYLKQYGTISEKEARAIAFQILAALAYIQQPQHRVIHYDIKPANILFDKTGQLKITDFGLSKVQDEGIGSLMELTSQGAGTYWYLPPECFETGMGPPMISSKVDIWSVGIILYQVLFGKRPFGHALSQERILREDIVRKQAHSLDFPPRPSVTQDCKQFIQACLTYSQTARPDVKTLLNHPFLVFSKPGKT